jgi:hypothetical protein
MSKRNVHCWILLAVSAREAQEYQPAHHGIDLEVGPPLVAFSEGAEPGATLSMWVKEGTITISTSAATTTMQLAPNSMQIVGTVGLAQMSGKVLNSYDVVLDLAAGTFGVELTGLDTLAQSTAGMAISQYFMANNTRYDIGTVFYSPQLDYPSLVPTSFSIGTQSDPAGSQCLLIFITTNGTPGQVGPISLPGDALPVPDGYTTALFLACKVLFSGVLAPQFGAALQTAGITGQVVVTATQPVDDPATSYGISVAPSAGAINAGQLDGTYGLSYAVWATPGDVMIPASAITISTATGTVAAAVVLQPPS